jgi:hypothetical protein
VRHNDGTISIEREFKRREVNLDLLNAGQDMMLVNNPGMVMNLVSSYRCKMVGGRPVNAQFCDGSGGLNLASGPEGLDQFREGRNEGWIEFRSEAEIAEEGNARLSQAFRRTTDVLWSMVTGRKPPGGGYSSLKDDGSPNLPTALRGARITKFTEAETQLAESLGIDLDPTMTAEAFIDAIGLRRSQWAGNVRDLNPTLSRGFATIKTAASRKATTTFPHLNMGQDVHDFNVELVTQFERDLGLLDDDMDARSIVSFGDLPNEEQEVVRDQFNMLVDRQLMSTREYGEFFEPKYGPLTWEPPTPPPESDLESTITLRGTAPAGGMFADRFEVVDGDTLRVYSEDGPIRIRLIGINAVDYNRSNFDANEQAVEQAHALEDVLRDANTISLGIFDPERYGSIQEVDPTTGEVRYLLWLYVDGEAKYDPGVFTFRNPGGVSSTGAGVPVPPVEGGV